MADSKASDHVKPCDIAKSEAHNRRDEDYLNAINKDKIYIRMDLTHKNKSYVSPLMNGVDLQTYYDQIKVMVKEKTGRAMQEKDVVVKKKNGKEGIRKGSSPIRESVVNITADTTMEQLQLYCERVKSRWGISAIQIYIHRDEGHYENPEDPSSWEPNYHAHILWDWMDHSTGKSWKLNAQDMSELQDMVAETLLMERGTSKSETNLEHLERNDYIIHKQENKKRLLEEEKAKSIAEKEAAETLAEKARAEKESAEYDKAIAIAEKNVIENAIVRVKSEKISAERDRDRVIAEKKDFEKERDQTEIIINQNLEKHESLKIKHGELVEKYNGLVDRYNGTLQNLNSWRGANDWQQYLVGYFGKAMYENDQTVKYAVDSLISYANNDDGRGGHQDFLHDDQSTAIKMVMMNFSPNDKSVWQKIGAWLLHLAKEFGHLSANAVRRIADELTSVADGRYDWRIDRFMRSNGMSR